MNIALPYLPYMGSVRQCMNGEQQQQHVMLTAGASHCRRRLYFRQTKYPASSGGSYSYRFCKVFSFHAGLLLRIDRLQAL